MIVNKVSVKKVFRSKKDMPLKAGQRLRFVTDVVLYVNGNMVPPNMQKLFYG
jgi:hypothetical protein